MRISIMRLRNVPGSRDMIAESPYTIKNETEQKGKWHLKLYLRKL